MAHLLKIGIVGCGAIGSSLAESINMDFQGHAKISSLFDLDPVKSLRLSRRLSLKRSTAVSSLKKLISRSDFVIECASARAVKDVAEAALKAGKDCMIMSAGGIALRFHELIVLADKHKAKIYIPSGAISGLDGLKASLWGGLKEVILTTRKNPVSFKGVPYVKEKGFALEGLKKDLVLFSGKAVDAVRFFPQNINVAAILSLAGLGIYNTKVRIIAVPGLKNNVHEIEIRSSAGRIFTRTENVIHPDNPKTSYLAVLSALACLKQVLDPVRIGT